MGEVWYEIDLNMEGNVAVDDKKSDMEIVVESFGKLFTFIYCWVCGLWDPKKLKII